MKFKIVLLAVFFSSVGLGAYSQTSDAEADAMINLLGVQKREAMSKLVPVTGKDSAAFWKIYDDYETKNKQTGKSRLLLYEKTAQSYSNMTPAVADSLSSQYFSNRLDQEKDLQTYYQKIKAATNAVVAFEFYQGEVYLLTLMRATIMQQIPTYGHLVSASKK
jgi:hypothetical protein